MLFYFSITQFWERRKLVHFHMFLTLSICWSYVWETLPTWENNQKNCRFSYEVKKTKQVTTITVFFTLTHNNQIPLRRVIAETTNLLLRCMLLYVGWNDSPWELQEMGAGKLSKNRAVA